MTNTKFSFVYSLLSKVILYLSFIFYPLLIVVEHLYSFKLLVVKARRSGLVFNNTWVSLIERESKKVSKVVLRICVKPGVKGKNTFFLIKF